MCTVHLLTYREIEAEQLVVTLLLLIQKDAEYDPIDLLAVRSLLQPSAHHTTRDDARLVERVAEDAGGNAAQRLRSLVRT